MEDRIREQVRTRLPRVAAPIEQFLRYGAGIQATRIDESDLPAGSSKIGGSPDLPGDVEWPEWDPVWPGKPLGFIAQIRLEDIAELRVDSPLPESGLLSFFYEADEQPWGFDPLDRGSARVFYFGAEVSNLTRRPFPEQLSEGSRFQPCKVSFRRQVTLPPIGSVEVEALNLTRGPDRHRSVQVEGSQIYYFEQIPVDEPEGPTPAEAEIYVEILDALAEECGDACHRLLGYPEPIQGDMGLELQLVSNGVYAGGFEEYHSEQAENLRAGAKDWRLLLQIDSDENAGMQWGDVGRIYYWIRQQDLQAGNFDKVWLILQCY